MTANLNVENISDSSSYPEGFRLLDEAYRQHDLTADDIARYGRYMILDAVLLDTPASVTARGEVLTNPSQIERVSTSVDGVKGIYDFAYFRQEPITEHLGKTRSVPYLIIRREGQIPQLTEFPDAKILMGEDPRVIRDVRLRGALGKVHTGVCVSTVIATPKPDNPVDVEGIKQVFYWGETFKDLEPVVEIPNMKNLCPFPVAATDEDTSVDGFGRPHPHITYFRVPELRDISEDRINSGLIITEGLLTPEIHTGVNNVKRKGPNHRELDIHEAWAPVSARGKTLHYRLGRYGYELPSRSLPAGQLKPLGVLATRSQFSDAPPKPPENGVLDYNDVLYGSMGRQIHMVIGASDRHVGYARVVRVA